MTLFITPDWPAPANIQACTTLRQGGISEAPYDSFNLGDHVGDNPKHVEANRLLLKNSLNLPDEPVWLKQTHSTIALPAISNTRGKECDATFAHHSQQVCVVMTADCLPILLCNKDGTHVAAIHAGWRGLADGIIEKTLQAMNIPPEDLLVWLGPAIGPSVYELGEEVRACFIEKDPDAKSAFVPSENNGRWLGNLYSLAKQRLHKCKVWAIYGGDYCTYSDEAIFFSYRRDGNKTGRMASLIWMT